MKAQTETGRSIAETVRQQITSGGERYWRTCDFPELSALAVSQALSRLARAGELERVSKGLYWRARQTALGPSRPRPDLARSSLLQGKHVFPAGLSAANLLGLTAQNPARIEVATDESSLPRQVLGEDAIIHTRRPRSWRKLTQEEAALLDVLRHRAETSELTPEATVKKLLELLKAEDRLSRLIQVAQEEPPRVRALLGAFAQQLGAAKDLMAPLAASLNPLSRFRFGLLAALEHAEQWQAKECL